MTARRTLRDAFPPTMPSATDSARFPVGVFSYDAPLIDRERTAALAHLETLPQRLREAVGALPPGSLDTPYREGGWPARQVVHHVADSHLNAYLRTKLALTEDGPTICPYDQDRFAALPDAALPVEPSLALLDGLHERWTTLFRNLDGDGWSRFFVHPEHGRRFTLDEVLAHYAWHGRHHTAHVRMAGGWLAL